MDVFAGGVHEQFSTLGRAEVCYDPTAPGDSRLAVGDARCGQPLN
jgi:hypothetical protein